MTKHQLFWCITITIISLAIFNTYAIGLFIASTLLIYFRYNTYEGIHNINSDTQNIKIDTIRPPLDKIKEYPELVDFLFSIQ